MPMVPILQYPDYEGARYSRSSVDLVVDLNHRIVGWTGWSYELTATPGKGYGGRAKPQVRTRGRLAPLMNLRLYQEDFNLLCTYLAAKGLPLGRGIMETPWQLMGTLYEVTLGTTIWTGLGCRIAKIAAEPGPDNDDPPVVSLDLDVMDILKDGLPFILENSPLAQVGVAV